MSTCLATTLCLCGQIPTEYSRKARGAGMVWRGTTGNLWPFVVTEVIRANIPAMTRCPPETSATHLGVAWCGVRAS